MYGSARVANASTVAVTDEDKTSSKRVTDKSDTLPTGAEVGEQQHQNLEM